MNSAQFFRRTSYAENWFERVLERVWPLFCLICNQRCDLRLLCEDCWHELPWQESACLRCGLPLGVSATECGACLSRPPAYDATFCALRYESQAISLIQGFKYTRSMPYGRAIDAIMHHALTMNPLIGSQASLLVPMPLHPVRQRERGFNQAMEIARPIGKRFGIPVASDLCMRERMTRVQAGLSAKERKGNMAGAFVMARPVSADHVIIIDDVITTGATVQALSSCLKAAGIRWVSVIAVPRVWTRAAG